MILCQDDAWQDSGQFPDTVTGMEGNNDGFLRTVLRFQDRRDNAGYFTIANQPGHITQIATFELEGEIYENVFELKYDGDRVTAFRAGKSEWHSMTAYGTDHYPSSAYPLLLAKAQPRFVYTSINEGTGEVEGETVLERAGDTITESRDGKTVRVFRMADGIPVEIDWGGPISTLCAGLDKAKASSPFA